jgi:hypothetical protein
VSTARPGIDRRRPCQLSQRFCIEAMSGRNAELGGLLIVRGRPRYWIGVARAGHPSMEATVCCRSDNPSMMVSQSGESHFYIN